MLTAIITAATISAGAAQIDVSSGRDSLLVNPRPYPANRVDSPDRPENSRLWHSRSPVGSRTPLREQWRGRIGAASYGAPVEWNDATVFVRVNHTPVAINPWVPFTRNGFKEHRTAQNIWLREQGWVLKVRTHVNPRYMYEQVAAADEIRPSATIRVTPDDDAPTFPARMEVNATEREDVRVWKPISASYAGPPRVIVEPEAELADVPANESNEQGEG